MEDLIRALQIFLKYANPKWPTHCEHDTLDIVGVVPADVSVEDKAELERLGFFVDGDGGADAEDGDAFFRSFRFGSA